MLHYNLQGLIQSPNSTRPKDGWTGLWMTHLKLRRFGQCVCILRRLVQTRSRAILTQINNNNNYEQQREARHCVYYALAWETEKQVWKTSGIEGWDKHM